LQNPKSVFKSLNLNRKASLLSEEHLIVGSGKSAISLILGYFENIGVFTTRMEEIFVPPWLGPVIYGTISKKAFPVLAPSKNIKCVYVYHQFGFLQDLNYITDFTTNRNIPMLEDSAHILAIKDSKLEISFISDYALHSPPKFNASPPIGIIQSKDEQFRKYVVEKKSQRRRFLTLRNAVDSYFLDQRIAKTEKINNYEIDGESIACDASLLYSSYPYVHNSTRSAVHRLANLSTELSLRKERLQIVYKELPNEFLPDPSKIPSNSAPFRIPVRIPEQTLAKIRKSNIAKDLGLTPVHFDFAQNMFKPRYAKSIALKIHHQVSEKQFIDQIEFISHELH